MWLNLADKSVFVCDLCDKQNIRPFLFFCVLHSNTALNRTNKYTNEFTIKDVSLKPLLEWAGL